MKKALFITLSVFLIVISLVSLFFWQHGKKTPEPIPAPVGIPVNVSVPVPVPARGMFEWRHETPENPESALALIEEFGITKWYQELPEKWDAEVVAGFSRLLHGQGVAVYALYGSVEWGFESDGATLISHLRRVTEYNKTASKDTRIDGVMLDVEPFITSAWKAYPQDNMPNYVDGMIAAYQAVAGQGLSVAICIPRDYDDQGLSAELERLIANSCDEVAVMNYECGAEVERIATEAALAQKYGKELHCILEFQEVGKHGLAEAETYRNKGLEAARAAWDAVDAAYPGLKITRDYHYTKPLLEMAESQSDKPKGG